MCTEHESASSQYEQPAVSVMGKNTQPTVVEENLSIKRRQGTVIPQEKWLVGSM